MTLCYYVLYLMLLNHKIFYIYLAIISQIWFREINQIILKYAIYDNKDFKENLEKIDIEEITVNEPTWYAKFKDKTIQKIDTPQAKSNSYL